MDRQNNGQASRRSPDIVHTVGDSLMLGISSLISYLLITRILGHTYFLSRDDELLGGMWAVAATIFVYRQTTQQSMSAALSRLAATGMSFLLCMLYLLIFPFSPWGLATLVAIGAMLMSLLGRSEDVITTGITTVVVMVVAAINPQHAWKDPILRFIDTIVGIVVGIAAAWVSIRVAGWLATNSISNSSKPFQGNSTS
ncbi:MAG TPA: FUSC family protein [Candidatus Acidoferrum sp.]|nr:FUSC family protein [Candidatus Acidoferrum sp.]